MICQDKEEAYNPNYGSSRCFSSRFVSTGCIFSIFFVLFVQFFFWFNLFGFRLFCRIPIGHTTILSTYIHTSACCFCNLLFIYFSLHHFFFIFIFIPTSHFDVPVCFLLIFVHIPFHSFSVFVKVVSVIHAKIQKIPTEQKQKKSKRKNERKKKCDADGGELAILSSHFIWMWRQFLYALVQFFIRTHDDW